MSKPLAIIGQVLRTNAGRLEVAVEVVRNGRKAGGRSLGRVTLRFDAWLGRGSSF